MQQLRNDYSLTFPPLSIARYSFTRLRHREENKNAQTLKRYQREFEPRLSRLRVRHSTTELPRHKIYIATKHLYVTAILFLFFLWFPLCRDEADLLVNIYLYRKLTFTTLQRGCARLLSGATSWKNSAICQHVV